MAKMKTYTTADGLAVGDLLHFGLDYISAAETLLSSNARHFDAAGYLAHIGFELLLKAWHLHLHGHFKATHSLSELWDAIRASADIPKMSPEHSKTFRALNAFADLRYPNLLNPIEIGSDDVLAIQDLAEAILISMPQEMHDIIDSLVPTQKAGRILMQRRIE